MRRLVANKTRVRPSHQLQVSFLVNGLLWREGCTLPFGDSSDQTRRRSTRARRGVLGRLVSRRRLGPVHQLKTASAPQRPQILHTKTLNIPAHGQLAQPLSLGLGTPRRFAISQQQKSRCRFPRQDDLFSATSSRHAAELRRCNGPAFLRQRTRTSPSSSPTSSHQSRHSSHGGGPYRICPRRVPRLLLDSDRPRYDTVSTGPLGLCRRNRECLTNHRRHRAPNRLRRDSQRTRPVSRFTDRSPQTLAP